MSQLTSTLGVGRVEPAMTIFAVPLLEGATFGFQLVAELQLLSELPPSQVWASDWEIPSSEKSAIANNRIGVNVGGASARRRSCWPGKPKPGRARRRLPHSLIQCLKVPCFTKRGSPRRKRTIGTKGREFIASPSFA